MVGISIIMPLYNAAKYLRETLNSVLKQTFEDFELICINDASTDATMEILHTFQAKDDRIKILSNAQHSGAAFSRNRGMDVANGKYFAFLDGDDIFDKTMLEKAYHAMEERHADLVIYQYQHVPSDSIHDKIQIFHTKEYREKYCRGTFSLLDCEPYEILHFPLGPCNKLYRRTLIESNQLVFQDLPCSNDLYFVCMALMLSERIIMTEDSEVMVYVRDHFETGRISSDRDARCSYEAFMQIGRKLVEKKLFDKLYAHFYYGAFCLLRNALLADHNPVRAKCFYDFLAKEGIEHLRSLDRQCFERLDEYIKSRYGKFREQSFESVWYREENVLKLFLYNKAEMVFELFEKCRLGGKSIAIWGAGENGSTLLAFCQQHHLEVAAVIDKSEEKQGSMLFGYAISSWQEVIDRVQVIIISACFIYDAVKKEIGDRNPEIIDINRYLCLV